MSSGYPECLSSVTEGVNPRPERSGMGCVARPAVAVGLRGASGTELEAVDRPVFVQVPCVQACALALPRMTVTFLLLCSPV